jgi:BioD-like phosphotransacetylase family protein
MSPVLVHHGTTRRVVDGKISLPDLERKVVESFAELEKRCDFIVIEGSGHPGVGAVMHLSNPRIASLLEAPVLLVTGGGLGKVVDDVALCLPLFRQEGAEVRAILVNKILTEKRTDIMAYLRRAFADHPLAVLGGLDWEPMLSHPTLCRVSALLDLPLIGDKRAAGKIIHHVQVAASPPQRVAEVIREGSLIIVPSNRDEILVTLARLYRLPEYRPRIVGTVIPGQYPVSGVTQRIIEESRIPYLRTQRHSTAELLRIIDSDVAKITSRDREKIEMVTVLAEKRLDFEVIDALCGVAGVQKQRPRQSSRTKNLPSPSSPA